MLDFHTPHESDAPLSFDSLPRAPREQFSLAWSELLVKAVNEPGLICEAYTRFHGYSLGNRLAALIQCQMRGIEPGPINSFLGWKKLGYGVKEGEKALCLCMPIKGTHYREKPAEESQPLPPGHPPDVEQIEFIRAFVWKPNWFVLSQTAPLSPDVEPLPAPTPLFWDKAIALEKLGIAEVRFDMLDGNALGFARKNTFAVSPLAPFPFKTLFHELAHIVLGHTTPNFRGEGNPGLDLSDGDELGMALVEVEAESVALICLATLDLPGQEFCRGYIQHWIKEAVGSGQDIPEKSAQRIFGAADRILAAGAGETRHRAPTAEEIGLSPLNPGIVSNSDIETQAAAHIASEPYHAPLSQPPITKSTLVVLDTVPAEPSETAIWALRDQLQLLHAGLHPADQTQSELFARALRHLQERDANEAKEVRELVVGASRGLKQAFLRIEKLLDTPDFDPFAETEQKSSPASPPLPPSLVALELDGPLSPTRQAAARRTVGRSLRTELQEEKRRFFEAAKRHELSVSRKSEANMLAAMSDYLRVPLASRRDLSSNQWARCASAIETEDLLWEKA